MKKWGILVGSFILLLVLAVRGLYKTVNRIDDEKHWYVSQLNLDCTLQVDSIASFTKRGPGFVFCNLISGEIDNSIEPKLNKKLSHHKRIRFLNHRSDGRYFFFSRRANKYQVSVSLQVDSNKDQVIFYREGKEIWRAKVSNSLREAIF